MAKNFRTLYEKMPAESQARVEARVRDSLRALTLDELRAARDITQVELAKKLHVDQAAISKLEGRTDMYLSTLDGVVRGMGGELELRAVFPSGDVHLLRVKAKTVHRTRKSRRAVAGLAAARV